MDDSTRKRISKVLFSCVLIGMTLSMLHAAPDDKLTPADLVARHLESIGSAEARAKVRGKRIKGSALVTVKLCGEGQVDGQVLISSSGNMNLIDMEFNTAGYPYEQSQQALNARIDAYEEFLDYKEEAGLNLPHTYKFHLSVQSEVRPALVDWTFNLNQFEFNASLDPAAFIIGHEQKN